MHTERIALCTPECVQAEIKYGKPPFQYRLRQKCGFLCLLSHWSAHAVCSPAVPSYAHGVPSV
eukprot:249795-Rhodomonas_salina.1